VDCLLHRPDGQAEPSGELCLAGAQVFGGYLNPGFDAQRFIRAGGRRWYRTGDQVRRTKEHGLVHLGRIDEQVKINGYRVELTELERVVERCVPGASCGAVVVSASGGLAALGAFVAGAPDRVATLRATLARELPAYMLPAHIWPIPELPVNQNGKIDRTALRELSRQMLST
jgi:acyl-CoA synthetase (AMP-forming)/AMP-acid ligase II